jgi:hypothetical protein
MLLGLRLFDDNAFYAASPVAGLHIVTAENAGSVNADEIHVKVMVSLEIIAVRRMST